MSPSRSTKPVPMDLAELRRQLADSGRALGISPHASGDESLPGRPWHRTARLRATAKTRADVGQCTMTLLLDEKGVLRWQPGPAAGMALRGRRGLRREPPGFEGEVVEQLTFPRLGLSEVTAYLKRWDDDLTPGQGLKQWDGKTQRLTAFAPSGRPRRVLLLVHGTFSNCQTLVEALGVPASGAKQSFLDWAARDYDAVLAYDHPTLSVSPLVNAVCLETALGSCPGRIDVVCHSRGGLVARWWHEVVCRDPRRRGKVVFVGAPLRGTSLAAPDKIRSAIDYLTNVGRLIGAGLGVAGTLLPFLKAAQGLMAMVSSATSLLAETPVADAMVGLIPGLAAMSAVANNFEIDAIRRLRPGDRDYYAVVSHYRPSGPGWHFWEYFTSKTRRRKLAADLIFPGAHDLVVDTSFMTTLAEDADIKSLPIARKKQRILDFGANGRVHHTNYFAQPETIEFLRDVLK